MSILDLPNEILLIIFKKLNNIDLFYSLMGIHRKLDQIACDVDLTKAVDLATVSTHETSDMVDRFCIYILPRIHSNVETLVIQASLLPRILYAKNYPNLHKLTLLNLDKDMASRYFSKKSPFIRNFKHQISHLVITIHDEYKHRPTEIIIAQTYVAIFAWLINLQHLDLDGIDGSRYSQRLLRGLSSTRCNSSNLSHVRIRLHNFDDCLCLLDGRLSQLHTLIVSLDYVRDAKLMIKDESTLLKLKSFSLYVCRPTVDFDSKIVPLLRQMLTMEKLTLSFRVRRRNSFIDGTYLTNEVLNYMPHLHSFIFDTACETRGMNVFPWPSSDDIRHTFLQGGYHTACYIDYHTNEIGRCHVYSLPYTMERIHFLTSRFPGGMFLNVRVLQVRDINRSFENTFFARISRSFPMLRQLSVMNDIERLEKPSGPLMKYKRTSSIIEYPHLVELALGSAHVDYVEQFLSGFNTCLPCLSELCVRYEHLTTVTQNFTRDATRINCAKLRQINFSEVIHLAHPNSFYLYFPSL